MEMVSDKRLARLIKWHERSIEIHNLGEGDTRDSLSALTELREVRKGMATFENWLSAPGANGVVSIERYDDGTFAADYVDDSTRTQRNGRGDTLFAALSALVGKEGGA